jgi:membrane-associated HD superfamily phosphohydrolase
MTPLRRPVTRDQRSIVIYGMLAFVLIIVIMQLWLLTATMNAYLGGDEAVIWPAAIASLACLVLNLGLLRYLERLERMRL